MTSSLQFFFSRPNTQHLGQKNCLWSHTLITTYLTDKTKNNRIGIKVLLGQMYRTKIPRKKKKITEEVCFCLRNTGLIINKEVQIFAWKYFHSLIISCWEVHAPKSFYPKADLVHECASCCQWVTWKMCHLMRVLRKRVIAVYTLQDYCNAIIWANTSKCCAWSSGLLHCSLVISIAYLPAGCVFTKAN